MKSLLNLFLIQLLLYSCVPAQDVASFNALIAVPIGDNKQFTTNEETDLLIEYSVASTEDSVNLTMSLSSSPRNGILKNCSYPTKLSIKCTYSPNKDFDGTDYFEFTTSDGGLKAKRASRITITVLDLPDTPTSYPKTINAIAGSSQTITLPTGTDPDSLTSQLSYHITSTNNLNGSLSSCSGQTCLYTSDASFTGKTSFMYNITDEGNRSSNVSTITINITKGVVPTFNGSENFTQGGTSTVTGVDIVWVIDNSGSMSDDQTRLKENFQNFIDNFLDNGKAKFPFNMGVTTTDFYMKLGNPFEKNSAGNTYDLSSSKAESNFALFKADFEAAVLVGTKGSGSEKSFKSMDKAYSESPSWYGDNDNLLVYIILSDEKEQSLTKSTQDWVTQVQSFKDKSTKLLIFPIINLSQDTGKRYEDAAFYTGTQVYDIQSSFTQVLDNISLTVSDAVAGYRLRSGIKILSSTIEVFVNGARTTNFTFSNNTVKLNSTPVVNSSIVINYKYENL